jgi:hypothetical protein
MRQMADSVQNVLLNRDFMSTRPGLASRSANQPV